MRFESVLQQQDITNSCKTLAVYTSLILSALELFGIVTTPHSIDHLMANCASVTPCVPPILDVDNIFKLEIRG